MSQYNQALALAVSLPLVCIKNGNPQSLNIVLQAQAALRLSQDSL